MKTNKNIEYLANILQTLDENSKSKLKNQADLLNLEAKSFIISLVDSNDYSYNSIAPIWNSASFNIITESKLIEFIENTIYAFQSNKSEIYAKFSKKNRYNLKEKNYFIDLLEMEIKHKKIQFPGLYLIEENILIPKNYKSYQLQKTSNLYYELNLLKYYIYEKLNLIIAYLTSSQVKNQFIDQYKLELIKTDQLIRNYEINDLEIIFFQKSAHLIIDNELRLYNEVVEILTSQKLNLQKESIKYAFVNLINTLYHNIKNWDSSQLEILNLYKQMYEQISDEFYTSISSQTIKNIVTLCIRYDQRTWFDEIFNPKNSKKLSLECQDSLKLCQAKFIFHERRFEECISILNQYKIQDIFQNLELRRLQIMCFYEMNERVLVDNYLNTFKVFIHRNDVINRIYKESNNNFIRILNRITKSIEVKKIEQTKIEIENLENIAEKKWLLEKIKDLTNNLGKN